MHSVNRRVLRFHPVYGDAERRRDGRGAARDGARRRRVAQHEAQAQSTQQAARATISAHDNWPVLLSDSFDSNLNANNWLLGDIDQDAVKGKATIADGKYDLSLTASKGFGWFSFPRAETTSDLDLSVDARGSGAANAVYGLIFRALDHSNYYEFVIVGSKYFLFGWDHQGQFTPLIGRTESAAIHEVGLNRLRVSAQGSHFMFFINQQDVAELDDSHSQQGFVGLRFGLDAGESADFQFANFELRAPLPTVDRNETATAQAVQPLLGTSQAWPLYLSDNFDSNLNLNGWPAGASNNDFSTGKVMLQDGAYDFDVTAKRSTFWWAAPRSAAISDFFVSVDAQHLSGTSNVQYGISFRIQDANNHYLFLVRDDQFFGLFRHYNGEWAALIGWSAAPAIRPGGVNRITVIGQGSHFDFFVNSQYVADYNDNSIPSGKIGVALQLVQANDSAVLKFDNFEERTPPQPTPTQTVPLTPTKSPTPAPTSSTVFVPVVVGASPENALEMLKSANLKMEEVIEFSTPCVGIVTRQEPPGGTIVPIGSTVRVFACSDSTPAPSLTPTPSE